MEQLKSMKQCLTAQVQAQMGNLQNVDTHELGAAVDMLKDLSEAIYYCTITEAMNNKEAEPERYYYTERYYDPHMREDYYRDMDRMYYSSGTGSGNGNSGNNSSSASSANRMNYSSYEYPMEAMRDKREGRSPIRRKTYMEAKEMRKDKTTQLKDLEMYMQELTQDLVEMIEDATPEEKQLLHRKMTALSSKIEQLSNG